MQSESAGRLEMLYYAEKLTIKKDGDFCEAGKGANKENEG